MIFASVYDFYESARALGMGDRCFVKIPNIGEGANVIFERKLRSVFFLSEELCRIGGNFAFIRCSESGADTGDRAHGVTFCLRKATRYDHDGVFAARLYGASDHLTRFSVTFGGHGAGVDDVYIAFLIKRRKRKTESFEILGYCLRFILIHFAPEGAK